MRKLAQKVRHAYALRRVFSGWRDIRLYRTIRDGRCREARVQLRLRETGDNPLTVRPASTDLFVLMSTFVDRYHLPQVDIPAGGVILDLGAYTGFTTAQLAHLYPDARVIAVEMDRENHELAQINTAAFAPRCRVVRAALWSENGEISFGGDKAWGYHVTADDEDPDAERGTVMSLTVDKLLADHDVDRVDFLKMDIEGAEAAVFATADRWLDRVSAMNLECHPYYNPRASVEICRGLLEQRGFVCEVDPRHELSLSAVHPDRCRLRRDAPAALKQAVATA